MLFFNCPDYYWKLNIMCVSVPAHVLVGVELRRQLSGVRSLLPLCGFRDQTLASSPALPLFTYCIDSKNRNQAQHKLSSLTGLLSLLLGDRQCSNLISHTHTQMKSLSRMGRMLNMLRWHECTEVEYRLDTIKFFIVA